MLIVKTIFSYFTGNPVMKWVGIGLVVALFVLFVGFRIFGAGVNEQKKEQLKKDIAKYKGIIDAMQRMDRATADSPRTRGELFERLRKGAG